MTTRSLAVVCAWCRRTMTAAPKGTLVTHTICPACLDWTLTHPAHDVRRPGHARAGVNLPPGYFGDAFKR